MDLETFICHAGANKQDGVAVNFPQGVTEIVRAEPCSGCKWRSVLSFKRKPEFEGVINMAQQAPEFGRAYFAYQQEKEQAERTARNHGAIFSWEQLEITRFPARENKIDCAVIAKV